MTWLLEVLTGHIFSHEESAETRENETGSLQCSNVQLMGLVEGDYINTDT